LSAWAVSHRADKRALLLADRHYNRQKVGSPQFVPPGRCQVFVTDCGRAVWVTSWPFAKYVKHAWAGAWVNSIFRNEGAGVSSALILEALAVTRHYWEPPELGVVSFVHPKKVPGVMVRGERIFGYCYLKAGFKHVGFTKQDGLWAWQLLPHQCPVAREPLPWHDEPEPVRIVKREPVRQLELAL
jgi:hypothetical protein